MTNKTPERFIFTQFYIYCGVLHLNNYSVKYVVDFVISEIFVCVLPGALTTSDWFHFQPIGGRHEQGPT